MESPVSPRPTTKTSFPWSFSMAEGLRRRSATRAPGSAAGAFCARVVSSSRCAEMRSSQFQGRQPEQHKHHGDDPEADNHLVLFPALQFVVMMQRSHAKNALAGEFE